MKSESLLLLTSFVLIISGICLDDTSKLTHKLYLKDGDEKLPIIIESSKRASHQMVSYILSILLEEMIGFVDVKVKEVASVNTTTSLNRIVGCPVSSSILSCEDSIRPIVMNLEVWVSPVFDMTPWIKSEQVVDCGPLGPYGSITAAAVNILDGDDDVSGWFLPTKIAAEFWSQNLFVDHWRALKLPKVIQRFSLQDSLSILEVMTRKVKQGTEPLCQEEDCVNGFFLGPGCQYHGDSCFILLSSYPEMNFNFLRAQVQFFNLPVIVAWIGDYLVEFVRQQVQRGRPVMFFDWWPSTLTVNYNFTQVKFPFCRLGAHVDLGVCDFEASQLMKLTSPQLQNFAPAAFDVLSRISLTQAEYTELLQFYDNSKRLRPNSHNSKRACHWMQEHEAMWRKWIPDGILSKTKIYLGGLFPLSGFLWTQPGLVQSAKLALDWVNANPSILSDYQLGLLVQDSKCKTSVAMKAFIRYVTNNTVPVVGILGPGCSDEAEPLAAVSKHFNMMIVSYNAEASTLTDRNKYPYFFRTVPHISHHRFVYEKLFQAMDWLRVGTISEVGKEFAEYHHVLKAYLQSRGIHVFSQIKMVHDKTSLDLSKTFSKLREKNIQIVIGDFLEYAARVIMCEAYRQRMTAYEGYVWFLPAWLPDDWWDVDYYNSPPSLGDPRPQETVPCTTEQMEYAIEGHLIISKAIYDDNDSKIIAGGITVEKFKTIYAEQVGKADKDESLFASFVYDAVWVFAYALNKLLKKDATALNTIHTTTTARKYLKLINETDFEGVSGRIRFQDGDRIGTINIMQYFHNETCLIGRYIPHSQTSVKIRARERDAVIKDDEGYLELYKPKFRWLTSNSVPPGDGRSGFVGCNIEKFRAFLGLSCELAIIMANVMAFGLFLIVALALFLFIKHRYRAKMKASHQKMEELGLLSTRFSRCLSLDGWELPQGSIVLNRKLGEGAFGTVFGGEAYLNDQGWLAVAVKTLKVGSSVEQKLDFLSEAEMMKRFSHPNIVQLLGVCTQVEPVYTIMEFLLHGDLKTFLLSRRNLVDCNTLEAEDICPQRLTQMATDIANGLCYLHDMKYVHRDLACRNCLVHSSKTVKIGDFGMTRSIYESDFYKFSKRGMLPVRWMSPESLWDGIFTTVSDIWSYGVVLFEILTFGNFPYQGMSNNQVLDYVKNGNRLNLPNTCPEGIKTMLYSCMAFNPGDRMKLIDVINSFSENPELLRPCLDPPVSSIAMEGMYSIEMSPALCQSTVNHGTLASRSLPRASEMATLLKKNSSTSAKQLQSRSQKSMSHMFSRPRSNSSIAPSPSLRGSMVMTVENFHMSLPLIRSGQSLQSAEKRENCGSDYFSENSKELCQTVTSV